MTRSKKQSPRSPQKVVYTKRFMTELQSTIAYGVYDSKEILYAGQTTSLKKIGDKMQEIYFPSSSKDNQRISHGEMFLGRQQKYKFLFDEQDKGVPVIRESLHRLVGKEI